MGLAYGMTQVGYLGSQAAKYLLLALKFTLGKIFDRKNVTTPLKFVFGENPQVPKELEQAWKNSGSKKTLGQKLLKQVKNIFFLALSVAVGLVIMLFNRLKSHQLRQKEL